MNSPKRNVRRSALYSRAKFQTANVAAFTGTALETSRTFSCKICKMRYLEEVNASQNSRMALRSFRPLVSRNEQRNEGVARNEIRVHLRTLETVNTVRERANVLNILSMFDLGRQYVSMIIHVYNISGNVRSRYLSSWNTVYEFSRNIPHFFHAQIYTQPSLGWASCWGTKYRLVE